MTKTFYSIKSWQKYRRQKVFHNKTIGFVPTMGNLHAGHINLLKRSCKENQITILSIFINPTQFDNAGDYSNYPKTIAADLKLAKQLNVDIILLPRYADLYPDNYNYQVVENSLSKKFCGKYRPGHFAGMLTVVLKLLQLTKSTRAYFGMKDWQQLQLVKRMTKAFFIDTKIIACGIVRDKNGLALSSRNQRLTPEQYQLALNFPKLLKQTKKTVKQIKQALHHLGINVDYIAKYENRILGAIKIGKIRLIDNFPCKNL